MADPLAQAFQGRALLPAAEAAAVLGISERTLRAHVKAGEIRCRVIGRGVARARRMFGLDDLTEFLERQRRVECPSTDTRGRRSSITTSNIVAVDFTAPRMPPTGVTPSGSKPPRGTKRKR